MTLFDDTNAPYSDSNTTTLTEQQPATEAQAEQSAQDQDPQDHGPHRDSQPSHIQPADERPAPASTDDFASALESFTTETEEAAGEDHVLKGTVLKLTSTHVVVDIGAKSEGMLPIAEVLDHEGKPRFQPGDEIDVIRDKGETEEGYINLSFQKAQKLRAWDEIEKAYSENHPIAATVVERTKGGVTVDILGARAFLPGSQIDLRPVRNLEGLKGRTFDVAIVKLNKKRGNIVASRKQLLEQEQNEKRTKVLEHLEEGTILTGVVKNLTEYGAFVDLGGIDGLLHITDMSWGRLTHPRDLVNVGDQIQVKVLKFDADKQRVSLGFKQLTPDPWLDAEHRYPVGAHVHGRVISVTDYGAFVELEQGIEGLVHVSEMTWSKRAKHPSKLVNVGDQVECVVLSVPSEVLKKGDRVKAVVLAIDSEKRRLSLGVKQLQPDVWESFFDRHRVGDIIHGKVLRVATFGAFVEIAEGVEGLCHNSEAVDGNGQQVHLEPGVEHDFKIIKMSPEEKKVGLSIRAVGEEASRHEVEAYKQPASSTGSTIGEFVSWKRAGSENG